MLASGSAVTFRAMLRRLRSALQLAAAVRPAGDRAWRLPGPLLAAVLVALGGGAGVGRARGEEPERFRPSGELDLAALAAVVAERSPELQRARLEADLAAAELHQSRLLENPTLDLGVAALPVGPRNPPETPLEDVPNYNLGLSWHPDLARLGPRQRRAGALRDSARQIVRRTLRLETLGLAEILGQLALAQLRGAAIRELLEEARGSLELAKSRRAAGLGTPLDVDRAEIDAFRLEQQVYADDGERAARLADCAARLGVPCEAFPTVDQARRFVRAWIARAKADAGAATPAAERTDLQALDLSRRAAEAEAQLARRAALPDPSLRLGYTYDRFVVSGNQRHSMSLQLTLPLPTFDHGQAAAEAAGARGLRLHSERERRLLAAAARIAALGVGLEAQLRRHQVIEQQMTPRAQTVVADMERAVAARALPLADVLQARRVLSELLLAEADSLADAYAAAISLLEELPEGPP